MNIGLPEILLLLFIALLLFGSKAVPDLGRRIRHFTRDIEETKREIVTCDEGTDFREVDENLLVFLSSVMNAQDDLRRERIVVKSLFSHEILFSLWRFEDAPADDELEVSYLEKVRECHLFLLIVGSTLSPAVYKEFEAAREAKKPILVFLKKDVDRTAEVDEFIGSLTRLNLRYKTFGSEEELQREVMRAAYHCVVKYYKHGLTRKTYLACLALLLAVEDNEVADIQSIIARYHSADRESLAPLQRIEQRVGSEAEYREISRLSASEMLCKWDEEYFNKNDFEASLRLAQKLVRTYPERHFFLLCLAWTCESLGDKDEAIRLAYKGYKALDSKGNLTRYETGLKLDFLNWARYWATGKMEHTLYKGGTTMYGLYHREDG